MKGQTIDEVPCSGMDWSFHFLLWSDGMKQKKKKRKKKITYMKSIVLHGLGKTAESPVAVEETALHDFRSVTRWFWWQ